MLTAAELADSVEDPYVRDRLLVRVADKCALQDDDEYALQLADAIEEEGLRQQALKLSAGHKSNKGQIDKARQVAEQMFHADAVLAAIAIYEVSKGNLVNAQSTIAEIRIPPPLFTLS